MHTEIAETQATEEVNRDYEPTLTDQVEEHNQQLDEMSTSLSDKGYTPKQTTLLEVRPKVFLGMKSKNWR
jgi:hypothetical protein